MQTEEQRTVFDKHHKDIGRANDFIRSRWPRQPPSAEKLDMKSFVAWAVSTTQNSTVLLFAIGLDSVFTHNTYSRNPRNPWLIYQFAEENEALAKHIAETWQGMQVPNGQRGRVDQIAKHVIYEYEDSFTLIPLECDADANVRVRIKDINIWSHPPRDEPLRRKLEEDSRFKQTEGNLKAAAKQIKKIRENDAIQIKKDQRDVRLQRQKSVVRKRFREYYHKYFCGLDSRDIPHSYQFPTLQLALEQEGAPPDRYGNTMAGVYGANDDAVHHKFSASGIPRVLPSEEEVFDNWLKFPCGLTYAELFQDGHTFVALRQIERETKELFWKLKSPSNLKTIAQEKGFTISENKGGGNCMFIALSEQLGRAEIEISPEELRQSVVEYLYENPKMPDGTDLFHFVYGYPSWDAYLKSMEDVLTWGDHVILYGVANYFKICVHVISSLGHDRDVMICPEFDDTGSNRLVLGHEHENHYVSLIPHNGGKDV